MFCPVNFVLYILSGMFCSGTLCPVYFVRYVLSGYFLSGIFCPGIFCPGLFCLGIFCPGIFCLVTHSISYTNQVKTYQIDCFLTICRHFNRNLVFRICNGNLVDIIGVSWIGLVIFDVKKTTLRCIQPSL